MLADLQQIFGLPAQPAVSAPYGTVDRGHGRVEWREIRVTSVAPAVGGFPGLAQVAEIRKRVLSLRTGEVRDSVHYLATSLPATIASPAALLALARGHWGIENRLHRVKDDSFGEDRHVQHTYQGGLVKALLLDLALNLLRGRLFLWREQDPMTARAQAVAALPLAVLLFTQL